MLALRKMHGSVLVVCLIFLAIILMVSITSYKIVMTNSQISGNSLAQSSTKNYAQIALEKVISSVEFMQSPNNFVVNPCGGISNTMCMGLNEMSGNDIQISLVAKCISVRVIPIAELNYANSDDASCLSGTNQNFGISGANADSLCADMVWDVQSTAIDPVFSSSTTIHQGIATRMPSTVECP